MLLCPWNSLGKNTGVGCYLLLQKWKSLIRVRLFATPWTIESMEFSRPECWSVQPFPSLGNLPNPGIEPRPPALQVDSLPAEPPGKPWTKCGITDSDLKGRCRQCSWEMLSRYKGNGIKYKSHVSSKVRSCCQAVFAKEGSKTSVVKFSAVSREDKNLNFQVKSPCVRSVLNWQNYDPLSKVKGWEGAPSFPLTLMSWKISIVSV